MNLPATTALRVDNENCMVLDAVEDFPLRTRSDRLQVITLPAPLVSLDAAYALWPHQDSLLWDPPAGIGATATGSAVCLRASGPERMARVLEASRRIWQSLNIACASAVPAPRFWGGFAFAPGTAASEPWQDFGDSTFVLPRLTYWRNGECAWLQAVGKCHDKMLSRDAQNAYAALARAAGDTRGPAPHSTSGYRLTPADTQAWRRQVEGIVDAISTGQVRKVVAARCARVNFTCPPAIGRVLANLKDEMGDIWRFAFTRNGATFLGATPEMLVCKRGAMVRSEALAGTLDKCARRVGDLMDSGKDRREHQFVLQGIIGALAPVCTELNVPAAPVIRELRQMYHLSSSIRGRLAESTHVLELCDRLHPTPATGGTPRRPAMEKILSTEPTPRGWYAAPVGWFDAAGDGELIVALRSGLIAGTRAYVYAGAGIVAGSSAQEEFAETELKQRVLLRALGILTP